MFIIEWFHDTELKDTSFSFDTEDLKIKKSKLVHCMKKGDVVYVSKMNENYDREVLVQKIQKITST